MKITNPESITVHSSSVILGHNPELADMGNPKGEIRGLALFLTAQDDEGSVFSHNFVLEAKSNSEIDAAHNKLDGLANTVRKHISKGGSLDPKHWGFFRVAYGSKAYSQTEAFEVAREKEDSI